MEYQFPTYPGKDSIDDTLHEDQRQSKGELLFQFSIPRLGSGKKNYHKFNRKVLHAVSDSGFFRGASSPKVQVLSYYLANFSPKTAGKCKKLDREKGACLQSLRPQPISQ